MTPNHDHATLFVASAAGDQAARAPRPAVNDAEAMRRLRDPFAVRTPDAAKPRPHHAA